MNELIKKLSGGDLRSDGRSNEVVEEVFGNLNLFDELMDGIREPDEVIRGRTADALEKTARFEPELLLPHRSIENRKGIKNTGRRSSDTQRLDQNEVKI